MAKYELLKIEKGAFMDSVMKEHETTNSWKEILEFVKNVRGTTDCLGLHIRFNNQDYNDMSADVIYSVADWNECSISKVTLKKLDAYCSMHEDEMDYYEE